MGDQRYFIGSDNSGHEYIVPVEKRDVFWSWSEMDEDDPDSWEAPEYALRLEGRLTFTDPKFD